MLHPFVLPLLEWTVANAFLLALTVLLWPSLRLGSRRLDALVFAFLGLFLAHAVTMVFGLAGALRPGPVLAASAAGLALFALAWRRGRLEAHRAALAETFGGRWTEGPFARGHRLIDGLLVAYAALQGLRLGLHVWLLPPYVWDSLSYHLPKVAEWVQHGALVIFDTPVERTFWPANHEILQTWWVLFPHHDALVDAANVPFYLLAAGAVAAIARGLGLARRAAVAAALVYSSTPAVAQHATSGNNDLPIAAVYLLLVAVWLDPTVDRRRRIWISALALGLAVGTKATIVFLLPGLLILVVIAARRRHGASAPVPALPAAVLGAAALLLGGYWYLRNAVVFGNPFHPTPLRLFGHLIFGSGDGGWQQGTIRWSSLVENTRALLGHRIFDLEAFNYSLRDITGWGWFSFACGLPALALGLFGDRRIRLLAAVFGVSLAALFASVEPDPWTLRFALWFPALFALAFFAVASKRRRPARTALATIAAAAVVLNVVGTLDIGSLSPATWRAMAGLPVSERSSAELGLFFGRRYADALALVPAGEPLGYNVNSNGWIYPLYGADLARPVRFVPIAATTDVAAAMAARGVRFLFAALPPPEARIGIAKALASGRLRQLTGELYVRTDARNAR